MTPRHVPAALAAQAFATPLPAADPRGNALLVKSPSVDLKSKD